MLLSVFILVCATGATVSAGSSEYSDPDPDAKSSVFDPLAPTTFDEIEEVFRYKGVHCDECKDFYDGPCPLHVLKHVSARKKPQTYLHRRAEKTAPKNIFRLEESSIPGAGGGMWAIKKIPKDVILGPLEGRIIEREPDAPFDGNYWQIPGQNNTFIDLMDKSKANYLAYINCARNVKEENLIRYFNETDKNYYFKTKRVIPIYSELLVDYGTEFRKTIGINDLDFNRSKELKRKIFLCEKCLKASYTPVELMPNHYCPVPSKSDDLWQKVLNNRTIVQRQVLQTEKHNPNAFKTVYRCNLCKKSKKNGTLQTSEKEMQKHFLRKHMNETSVDPKTLIRDDFVALNKLCYRYYKCNICSNQSAGLNWTMPPERTKESIEFEQFVKGFEKMEKEMDVKTKHDDNINKFMNLYNIFTPEEQETTAMKLEITTAGAVNVTKKKLKIDKKIFYKSRDDVQCHFKIMHMPLVNITDTRVMKYRGDPHECSLCGNETIREYFDLDHHVSYHLNFTEMFDKGLIQLDYRTKKFNEPYIEAFNFSHLFCTKCNRYIDTDKNHEPEPEELMDHKLSHVNLELLGFNNYLEKKTVQIAHRAPTVVTNHSYIQCGLCSNYNATNTSSIIHHLESLHNLQPHHMLKKIPEVWREKLKCHKCNATFDYKADLINHVTKVHQEYYYCVACGRTNYYRNLHQRHMVSMHNNSTATVIHDYWDRVDKLWTSISEETVGSDNLPTYGDSIFTVDSKDYTEPTVPYNFLNSLGN